MTINKRIVGSVATIVTAGALLIGATFAYFSDSSSSSNGNQFRSGVLDLHVADNDQTFADTVTASFVTPANWAPGQKHVDFICFKNNGSVDIEQVLFSLTSPDANVAGTTLDDFVYVSNIELGPVTASECLAAAGVGTQGLTNFKALFDIRFGPNAPLSSLLTQIDGSNQSEDDLLDGPAKLAPGDIMKFRVEWTFDSTATSNEAGETVTLNIGFNATQNELP